MLLAVNDGNWRTPVALAGNQPIAEPVNNSSFTNPPGLQPFSDLCLGGLTRCTAKFTRIDHRAVTSVIKGIPVKFLAPQQFHQGSETTQSRIGLPTFFQDLSFTLGRIPGYVAFRKQERPLSANDFDFLSRQDMMMYQLAKSLNIIRWDGQIEITLLFEDDDIRFLQRIFPARTQATLMDNRLC